MDVNSASFWQCLILKVAGFFSKLKKIGKDDPRRVVHSLKVGFGLALVSSFYYVTPLFKGFGESAIWAVLTVVLVMEFNVGASLTKGLNRVMATLLAAGLGVGAHHLAILPGEKGEPILLGLFVFLIAATATFARFIPEMKARYDYGLVIFILTFCLVGVSSYRKDKLIVLAYKRLETIAIGVVIALGISILVFPVWAGEDLHKLAAVNLGKLASFFEGLNVEYFGEMVEAKGSESKLLLQVYKSVLSSKPTEESLANFARWEPGHGCFGFRHPWSQYLKIGARSRQCAYIIETLNIFITRTPEALQELELHKKVRSACKELGSETGKALKELSSAIQTMTTPCGSNHHMAAAIAVAERLKISLSDDYKISEVLKTVTIVSLLVEIIKCTQQIVASVDELARLGHFKSSEAPQIVTITPLADAQSPHVSIDIQLHG